LRHMVAWAPHFFFAAVVYIHLCQEAKLLLVFR
jgi:hypothetical protein